VSSVGGVTGSSQPPTTRADRDLITISELKRLPQAPAPSGRPPSSQGTSRSAFLRAVLDDAETLWQREFRGAGLTYRPARLTIFSLDPTFFAALSRKAGVRIGDVAQAYVVAHEIGHHVQTLLGITHQKAAADQADKVLQSSLSNESEQRLQEALDAAAAAPA
jgi:predicted metalloprotease